MISLFTDNTITQKFTVRDNSFSDEGHELGLLRSLEDFLHYYS